jgi:hypothetical protein
MLGAGGRHLAGNTSRRRLVIGAGVVVVAAAIGVPLALNGSEPSRSAASDPGLGQQMPPGRPPDSDATSASPSGAASSAEPTGTTSPTPRPSRRPPTTTAANPTSIGPPPFTPVTVEAEAGAPAVTLSGSARITPYVGASNGSIVQNVGEWNIFLSGPGSVRFNGLTFPTAGTYVLTIAYVHPDSQSPLSAQVTVSGVKPVTVNFAGSSLCCDVTKVSLPIPAGTRSITIGNPADKAPAIDKITISRG